MQVETGTITVRGQMTLPASLRKELHLEPGDKVILHREGNVVTMHKAESKPDSDYIHSFDCLLENDWDTDADPLKEIV